MFLIYFILALQFVLIVSALMLVLFQQRMFYESMEKLQQKLIAKDLKDYTDNKIAQEEPVGEDEEPEPDMHVNIDDLPEKTATEAVEEYLKEREK